MTKKSITNYEAEIRELHAELIDYPDSKTLRNRLSARLGKWQPLLDIVIRVAQNERKPWTDEEIGMLTIPMMKKADNGFQQVGDYQFEISNDDQSVFTGGLLIERKELSDLYGTLMNRERRSRFYREIQRYGADTRFNQFHLIAECTYEEFLKYVPEIFVFSHESAQITKMERITEYIKRYYKIKVSYSLFTFPEHGINIKTDDGQIQLVYNLGGVSVLVNGVLRETLIKRVSEYGKTQYFIRRGATEVSKIETINSIENRIQVSFVGSRARAVEKYPGLVRQWCIKNYAKILNIGDS